MEAFINYILQFGNLNKQGFKQGAYESYYTDGKTQESFHNVADSIDGIYRYYYPSGQLWTETIYNKGKTINAPQLLLIGSRVN